MNLLLRLVLRGAVGSGLLMLGCSQGHRTSTSSPIPVAVALPRLDEAPAAAAHPSIKIIEVSPVSHVEDQEFSAVTAPVLPTPLPPLVVRAACEEATTAAVPLGHAPDYRWLTGELRYSPARGSWCLHYAAWEEQDRHGGSVTLIGADALASIRAGQMVRVEGELIDPESREPSPAYRVRRLLPLRVAGLVPAG